MEFDDLGWLCAELGLPVLEETEQGLLANPAARIAGFSAQTKLLDAVLSIAGLQETTSELLEACEAARRGERRAIVLATPARSSAVRALITPARKPGLVRVALVSAAPSQGSDGLVDVAAAVSHEVANAVGSIRGWADLALHGGDATVDVRDALTLIRSAARSAEQAARGMLSLARGDVDPTRRTSSDMSEFASELLQLLTLTAREHRVTLESFVEPALWVRAARADLFTIVFNLVKNAIEACPPGGLVRVWVEGDAERVRLLVRDSGEGLDEQARARLFDRYYTTKRTGTGLGLALVRDAVKACSAELELESEKGRGSLFRVIFTRSAAAEEEIEPSAAPDPAGQGLHARVLVVDDDRALREMLATALSLRGAEVVSVGSAEEALRLGDPFDIALIDMMLEGCRGDELLSRLRQRGVVQAAMLVTGTVQKPRLVPGGEPDDWLRKPFEIAQLVDRIRRTLERHRMLHDASQAARI